MNTEKTYTAEEVAYMLELIYIIENIYYIDFFDVDERFAATEKMYDKFEEIYEKDSESSHVQFGYRSEIYDSEYTDEIVLSVLNEMNIKSRKFNVQK